MSQTLRRVSEMHCWTCDHLAGESVFGAARAGGQLGTLDVPIRPRGMESADDGITWLEFPYVFANFYDLACTVRQEDEPICNREEAARHERIAEVQRGRPDLYL